MLYRLAYQADVNVHRQSQDSPLRSFIYSDGVMQDLNKLIPADSGWSLTEAKGINESGQIVGYGFLDCARHAFLLTHVKTKGALKTVAKLSEPPIR